MRMQQRQRSVVGDMRATMMTQMPTSGLEQKATGRRLQPSLPWQLRLMGALLLS